jgi:hypothetical protein
MTRTELPRQIARPRWQTKANLHRNPATLLSRHHRQRLISRAAFSVTNFNRRSHSYKGPYLGHIRIGHRDAAVGPVDYKMKSSKPCEHGRETMDFDGASRIYSEILRAAGIDRVRKRNVEGAVEPAAISLRVDHVLTLGCPVIAAPLFRAPTSSAQCHFVGLQYLASSH